MNRIAEIPLGQPIMRNESTKVSRKEYDLAGDNVGEKNRRQCQSRGNY